MPKVIGHIYDYNKKASKMGYDQITVSQGTPFIKKVNGLDAKFVPLIVENFPDKFGDYKFKAKLIRDHASGVTLFFASDEVSMHKTRESYDVSLCDHCGLTRSRNKAFVVSDKDDKEIQVGSGCLKYFLPKITIQQLEIIGDFWSTINEDVEPDNYLPREPVGSVGFKIEDFIHHTVMIQKWHGKYTNGMGHDVFSYMNSGFFPVTNEYIPAYIQNDDSIKEEAKKVLEWARNLNPDMSFLYNLKSGCTAKVVGRKTAGIVGAVYHAYKKAVPAIDSVPNSMGCDTIKDEPGVRGVYTLKYKSTSTKDGYNGGQYIQDNFEDGAGKIVLITGLNTYFTDEDKGTLLKIKGTIVSYFENNGTYFVKINRGVLLQDEA